MTALTKRVPVAGLVAGIAMALILAGSVTQYLRSSWPFPRREVKMSEHAGAHAGAQQPAPLDAHASHESHGGAGAASLPAGYAPVEIDPGRAAALKLQTEPIEERDFTRVLRTVGVVALDETRSAHVHSKIRGWIDGIHVNFVGRKVRAGEPLCSIYSQDVYSAEMEFLSILERASGRTGPDPLLEAARKRLALWDVPASEIDRLQKTREPKRTFPLLAPRSGTVVSKEAIEGMYVEPSLELYTVSDMSRVWVLIDIYESDVPDVHAGDAARLSIEGSATPLEARISFLSPTIDEATRTRKVRFELDNRAGRLLPGAFVSAEMNLPVGKGLAVPESAVIRTGARSIVFVAHGARGEHLEPREISLGPLIGDHYRVESGLSAGERVATGAQFLLDSESRLRATSAPGSGHAH